MDHKKCVFIIDDDIVSLHTGRNALQSQYSVFVIQYIKDLSGRLKRRKPDLILLDADMPGVEAPDVLREIRSHPETAEVPVVFLYDRDNPEEELSGLSQGAADYIVKPFLPLILRKKVELYLRAETLKGELRAFQGKERLSEMRNAVISWAADLLEFREDVTGHHAENIKLYLRVFAEAMQRSRKYAEETALWDVDALLQAAVLHDVGKIKLHDDVLLKRGRLTDEEFETLKLHTVYGRDLLDNLPSFGTDNAFLDYAKDIAYMHHEKWDGTGYPNGLKGEEIPLQVRVMIIVDVYDALVSERPYKKAFSHDEAMRIIFERRGAQFDPGLTDLFMSLSHELSEM
ncbi:MAG: response regulator [Oscillospiraceae bacterium]|jgi:putative two-component system response regulator|nr:response regulator [Oscillospiraceae bacterium]